MAELEKFSSPNTKSSVAVWIKSFKTAKELDLILLVISLRSFHHWLTPSFCITKWRAHRDDANLNPTSKHTLYVHIDEMWTKNKKNWNLNLAWKWRLISVLRKLHNEVFLWCVSVKQPVAQIKPDSWSWYIASIIHVHMWSRTFPADYWPIVAWFWLHLLINILMDCCGYWLRQLFPPGDWGGAVWTTLINPVSFYLVAPVGQNLWYSDWTL